MNQRKEIEKQIATIRETALKFDGMVEEKISTLMNQRNAAYIELQELKEKIAEMERQSIDYKIQITQKDAMITGLQQQLNQAQAIVRDSKKFAEMGYGMAYKWTDDFNRPISRGSASTGTPVPSNCASDMLVSTVTCNEGQKNGIGMKKESLPQQMMDFGNVGNEVMVVEILEEEEENNVNPNNTSDSMAPMDPLL